MRLRRPNSFCLIIALGAAVGCTDLDNEGPRETLDVQSALEATGTWFPIGPAPLDTTITYAANGNIGTRSAGASGRANVIAVNPGNIRDVWLGTAGGGVWRTTNADTPDAAWRPMTDRVPGITSSAVGAILLDGCGTGGGPCSKVYIGTGENSVRRDTLYGTGLIEGTHISDEFGSRYSFSEHTDTATRFRYGSINNILLGAGGELYITLSTGVSASLAQAQIAAPTPPDGFGIHRFLSGTWTRLNVGGGALPTDLEKDPVNPGGLLAGFDGLGIFRSPPGNDGLWCPMNPGNTVPAGCPQPDPDLPAAGTFDHVEIAVLTQPAAIPNMYAMFGNCPFSFVNQQKTLNSCVPPIFRTDDGNNWFSVAAATPSGQSRASYSRYTHVLKMQSASTVFHGALILWKSTDSGQNFADIGSSTIHADHHDLVIFPGQGTGGQDLLYSANDGGFYFSRDSGQNWESGNFNLVTTQFYGIGVDDLDDDPGPNDSRTKGAVGGMQDNGSFLFKDSRIWQYVMGGDGGEALMESDTVVYVTSQRMDIQRSDNGAEPRCFSFGNGCSLTFNTPGFDKNQSSFEPVYLQHPSTKEIFAVTDKVWKSPSSSTPTWTQLSPVLDPNPGNFPAIETTINQITALGVAPSDANRIYVGLYDGQLWRTKPATGPCSTATNGVPDCWETVDGTTLPDQKISSISVHPSDPGRVWVSLSAFDMPGNQYVWTTADGGTSGWTAMSQGLANSPANVVKVDPREPTILWLGTDTGAYRWDPSQSEWAVFGGQSGLPVVPVLDIEIQPAEGRVYAATHGRGVWALSDSPSITTFEGWTEDGIWDIPIYGTGFKCSVAECECTISIIREDGSICSSSNIDAANGRVSVRPGDGVLRTANQTSWDGLPVVWGCLSGNCVNNVPIDMCNLPNNRISSVLVQCDQNPDVQSPVAGECPQQAQPPSTVLTMTLPPGGASGPFEVVPTIVATADGGDRALCAASAGITPTDTAADVLRRVRDAINSSPDCASAGVSAQFLNGPLPDLSAEDPKPRDLGVALVAPNLVGSQLILGVRTAPGGPQGVCFRMKKLGDYLREQIAVLGVSTRTDAAGAAGGSITMVERSPVGQCTQTVQTTAGQSAAQIAAAFESAFQAPALPGPETCRGNQNPRDIELETPGGRTLVTVAPTSLDVCVQDARVGFSAGPHGVDVESIPANATWAMFRHTAPRRGSTAVVGPQVSTQKWRFDANNLDVESSPAVGSDGTIYIGGESNRVYAIRPDGTLRWSFTTGADVDSSPALSIDGRVYVGSNDGRLYALMADTGALVWQLNLGIDVNSSPAIALDGTIYVGADTNRLYAVTPSGSIAWSFDTGGDVDSSPAIGPDGTVYIGSDSNTLFALQPNGSLKWSRNLGGDINATPAVSLDGSTVYVGSEDERLYAVRAQDGVVLWSFKTGGDIFSSPAVGANGTVYVGSDDNRVYAFNGASGAVLWTFNTGGDVSSSPAVGGDGKIYVGSDDNRIYALRPEGTLLWSRTTGGDIDSSPAIGQNGVLYVGSDDDGVYAIGP